MSMTNLQVNRTFKANRLPSLSTWEGEGFTINQDKSVTLASNGFIQYSLVYDALASARYRWLHLEFQGSTAEASNINNKQAIEFILTFKYYDDDGSISYEYFTIPVTKESITLKDAETNTYSVDKIVECTEVDSNFITARIVNNLSSSVTITNATLRQSYDTQSSAVLNALNFKSRIQYIDIYDNAVVPKYYGYEDEIPLTRSDDGQGNINGVWVGNNNEQFVPITRYNFNR